MDLLIYTRPGYEKEAAQEMSRILQHQEWPGYCRTWDQLGFCGLLSTSESTETQELPAEVNQLTFARQWLSPASHVDSLPEHDRISPLLAILQTWLPNKQFRGFYVEHPDTNEGRELAHFCKKWSGAFNHALKKQGFRKQESIIPSCPWIHVCFLSYEACFIGLRYHQDPAWALGIPRLKIPHDAPSRSTLKLEEAFFRLMNDEERSQWVVDVDRKTAVDLGASPGGWTYYLVQKGYWVSAVDNGPMDGELMKTGMMEHLKQDAFHYRPKTPVNLMVCDMVAKPSLVVQIVEQWFTERWCRFCVFNLKLPMKQKYREIETCLEPLRANPYLFLRASHLYHNRDEITVLVGYKDSLF